MCVRERAKSEIQRDRYRERGESGVGCDSFATSIVVSEWGAAKSNFRH